MPEKEVSHIDTQCHDADILGRVHSLETMGTLDGPGIRFVVFLQGCPMRCAYCHNPDTWDMSESAGTRMSVDELLCHFESNRPFYRTGGITVSGGEPLLQTPFVAELFSACHAQPKGRIHTCLDTCGYPFDPAHPEHFHKLLAATDLVLLDIKHADPAAHTRLTGRAMDRIVTFGDELARLGIKTIIRHVVVPGITDSEDECEALGKLIAPWKNVSGLELLPYHTLGIDKYKTLGIPYPLDGVPEMNGERLSHLREVTLNALRKARK